MRFCMITTFFPPFHFGGDGLFVQRLSNELARRGHTVEVVHCVDSYRLLGGKERPAGEKLHPNVRVHRLKSALGPLAPAATYLSGRPLVHGSRIRSILSQGFDVVHFHNISLVGGPGILACGDAVKLYTPHEYWLVCPTHVLFRNRQEACDRRRCLRCLLAHGRPPQPWRWGRLVERSISRVDCFLGLTHFVLAEHERRGLRLDGVVLPTFAPQWMEPDTTTPSTPIPQAMQSSTTPASPKIALDGMPRDGEYFLFSGRLEKLKGLQTLLPLFRRRPDLRLLIAGSGSYERHLKSLALGHDNIAFLGRLDKQTLAHLYRGAIALLVPSLCPEIAPLVILEAFQQGTPVIARRIGSIPEMLGEGAKPTANAGGVEPWTTMDGDRGELFDTIEEAEAAMDRLSRDRERRAALSRACLAHARDECSLEKHVDRYLEIVARLVRPGA
ncbi:MAG: glycosyltransferase family 4 protein [Candidatus Eisenbacteria bacterium]|nr:glycosyltransferase family 4 protein [Candidatus Eisenbacteria bacterium]